MRFDELDLEYLLSGEILHLTGIAAALSESCHDLIERLLTAANERGVTVPFVPTGGVSLGNIVDWFAAGAFAVGAGGALAPSSLGGRDRGEVVENARRCAEAVRAAREQ